MKSFFVEEQLNNLKQISINGIEHNHIKNVMRMSVGDEIILVCGDEYDYVAKIISIKKGETICEIESKSLNLNNPTSNVTIFQALVKSDNMSLIVQKLNELGVKNFQPFESEFVTSKDKFGKVQKLQEISNQSSKQCKRSIPMKVEDIISFNQVVNKLSNFDEIIFANECEKVYKLSEISLSKDKKIAVIIGSEGGFSSSEIEKLVNIGAKSITLGKRILRAETASIALTSVVMYKIGEWEYE
ncbi:MAG: RsmE family RNA methyltransferase [Christensenellales bacterium]